jgi:hypothetical protein
MAWDSRWLPKFKNDMREKNADIGVIISKVLPEEIQDMGTIDGVWVCKPSVYPILLNILRDLIMRLKRAELAAEMPKDQKDFLFQYMTSNKFAQRIQGICEKTKSMRDSLESEKNAYDRIWKRRAIEIEQINSFVSGIYGEIEGFVGKALPKIDGLELESFGDRGSLPANINSNERA